MGWFGRSYGQPVLYGPLESVSISEPGGVIVPGNGVGQPEQVARVKFVLPNLVAEFTWALERVAALRLAFLRSAP